MPSRKAVVVAGAQGFGGIVTQKNLRKLKFHNFSGRGTKVKTSGENIAESVIKILKDDELKDSLELFSIEVANDFDIRTVAGRIEEIYYGVIG
mgnify:CR=1 FL=1